MADMERCANGHLLFSTPLGKGCLKSGCTYRAPKKDGTEGKRKPKEIYIPPDAHRES
jgi:hypothetical protein